MPIPKPKSDETKDQFISRCMGSDVMVGEFPDQSQRAAVCNSAWSDRKQMSKTYDLKTEIFATGKWNGLPFSQQDLDTIVAAFESLREVHKVPLKFGHNDEQPMTDGQPALGWVEKIWTEAGKLFAHFTDVPEVVYDAVRSKRYRHVSVELDMGVEHKGNHYPWVLSGVALLGADIPAVNTLSDLQAYMGRSGELSFSKRVAFSAIQGNQPSDEDKAMSEEALKAEIQSLKDQIAAVADQNKKFSAEKVALESKVTEYEEREKQRAEADRKAKFAQARTDIETKLESMVKSDTITPAQREKFMAEFKEDDAVIDRLNFTLDVLEAGNPGKAGFSKKETAENDGGNTVDNGDEGKTPDQIVVERTKKFMRENNVKDFSAAKRQVLQLDDDLAAQYRDCNGTKTQ